MTTQARICAALNTDDAVTYGLSNSDARVESNQVIFTYPAPVISGACVGTITVHDDGRIHDDTSDSTFDDFDAWKADLDELMNEEI